MNQNVSGQSVYCNPPWPLAIQCVKHLRACYSRSPLDNRAIVVLPDWSKFKTEKELKLIKRLPKGEGLFMRTSPTGTYDPPDLIPSTWSIIFWLIDVNTPVLSPLLTTNVGNLKPNIVRVKLEPEAAIKAVDENISTTSALVIVNLYEAEVVIRFTASVSYNGLSSTADTLIDTAA